MISQLIAINCALWAVWNLTASSALAQDHVFWASEPVRPNETVMLAGDDLDKVSRIRIRRAGSQTWSTATALQTTPVSLKFVVPADWKIGVYECEIKGSDWTQTLHLNDAEIWWMQGDGGSFATPGGTLRVFGKLMNLSVSAEAVLKTANGPAISVRTSPGDGYSLSFALPTTLPDGDYQVMVRNGATSPWGKAGVLEVKAAAPWPQQIFNVMDFYGAEADTEIRRTWERGRPPVDRTEAILAAVKKAEANGGGIVYLPQGQYAFDGELKMPARTILKGEGMGLTVLRFGKGDFALDGGSDKRRLDAADAKVPSTLMYGGEFGVRDLSMYLPRTFATGINAGENFLMERVRIRVDRYWIRSGEREHETTLRVGDNARITDCDILSQGLAIAFSSGHGATIARNKIMAAKSQIAMQRCDGSIVEDNEFVSLDPTAYINVSDEGRNIYYARNKHSSLYVQQSDFSFTFDGQGSAYLGKVVAVDRTKVTLASDPIYPDYAKEENPLWRRCVVAIMDGKGTGQYRYVTANAGRAWQIDRPFDVKPDGTSIISIFPFRGRTLVVGNRFEDANWVNMGYGSSLDVICADNDLYRCGYLLNYGLRQMAGVHASWYVQYFNNQLHEGHTQVEITSDQRKLANYDGTVTRYCVQRGARLHPDNSGLILVKGTATDIIVENCKLDHPRNEIFVDKDTAGVLIRNNKTLAGTAPRLSGEGLKNAVIVEAKP